MKLHSAIACLKYRKVGVCIVPDCASEYESVCDLSNQVNVSLNFIKKQNGGHVHSHVSVALQTHVSHTRNIRIGMWSDDMNSN